MRDNHDIIIVSDEIGKSKPASLFFLAKFGCLVEQVKFYSESTINSLWDSVDVLLTANPKLLLNYPKGKTVIKYETSYNKDIDVEHSITTIKDLKTKITELYVGKGINIIKHFSFFILKVGHSWPLFIHFSLFNTIDSKQVKNVQSKF